MRVLFPSHSSILPHPDTVQGGVGWGKADLHIHTAVGDGTASIPDLLDYVEEQTDLDLIAITDHDRIDGALRAASLVEAHPRRFQVIVGCEVTTLQGHLLALFLQQPVPMCRPLERTIEAVHAQGGICVVPHPMSCLTRSVGQRALERVLAGRYARVPIDGIETVNPSPAGRQTRAKILHLNRRRYRLPETGGSDSHHVETVGSAYTLFPGTTAADLRRALAAGQTIPRGVHWSGSQLVRLMLRRTRLRWRRALEIGAYFGVGLC